MLDRSDLCSMSRKCLADQATSRVLSRFEPDSSSASRVVETFDVVLTLGSHSATTCPAPKATIPVIGSAEETEQNRLAPTEMYSVLQEMTMSSDAFLQAIREVEVQEPNQGVESKRPSLS